MIHQARHFISRSARQHEFNLVRNSSYVAVGSEQRTTAQVTERQGTRESSTCRIQIPDGFVVPEPKPLRVADGNYSGALTALVAAGLRLGSGIFTVGWRPTSAKGPWPGTLGVLRDSSVVIGSCARPAKPVILWDNEADPRCRLVREACSMLDLDVEMRPSSSLQAGGAGFALKDGSVLLNTTKEIVDHLFENYGPGKHRVPWMLRESALTHWSAALVSTVRSNAGSQLLPSALPEADRHSLAPLMLWGFEGSPFVRPVRETLSSLGIRHVLVSCARGSLNRDKLFRRTGRFQVPYLEDPNTGVKMFESGAIVQYLLSAYTITGSGVSEGGAASASYSNATAHA